MKRTGILILLSCLCLLACQFALADGSPVARSDDFAAYIDGDGHLFLPGRAEPINTVPASGVIAIDAYRARSIDLQDRPLIFGIDGTAVGLEAIRSHEMAGTVYNDKDGQAKAMLELALRLAQQEPIDDLDMIDGKYIRLPYTGITAKNADEFE